MEYKYISWFVLILSIIISVFGVFWFSVFLLSIVSFTLGVLTILYLQHGDLDKFLNNGLLNPLEEPKTLGLNLVSDQKPILLISPNIKIQTESKNSKTSLPDNRKRSIIDSGIELLFKKHNKHNNNSNIKDGHHLRTTNIIHKSGSLRSDTILENNKDEHHHHHHQHNNQQHHDEKRWKPFESIKIYTERKTHKLHHDQQHQRSSGGGGGENIKKNNDGEVMYGEECANVLIQSINKNDFEKITTTTATSTSSATITEPKKILSGNKQIDELIHLIIDYIKRDFIDSWFGFITDNNEFNEIRARNCIEESIINICNRTKNAEWVSMLTTKVIDDIATHTRYYRLANQTVLLETKEIRNNKVIENLSPQRKSKNSQHKRNKSDTELNRIGGINYNPKMFPPQPIEKTQIDPELRLLEAFFENSDLFKKECLDELTLEKYLTNVTETILYFTLPEEDFSCLPLRTFLCTLLANVVFKPLLDMISDPDFINLQIARMFSKDPPAGEFLIKMIRQCTDLSELRACRQLITHEMDLKFKDTNCSAELASLKYTQKLIDIRISHLQNNISTTDFGRMDKDIRSSINLPILTLDELLTKELALSYYLDYLSILNLQKYIIFYLTAQEWKHNTTQFISDTQISKKVSKEEIFKHLRDKALNLYQEYLLPTSINHLNLDFGLVEALTIKIKDTQITPENTWFDSICKFIYEKIKNEDVFLNNFYQSSSYKKLLLELDVLGQHSETDEINMGHLNINMDIGGGAGSDTNSNDMAYDDDDDIDEIDKYFDKQITNHDIKFTLTEMKNDNNKTDIISTGYDLSMLPLLNTTKLYLDDEQHDKQQQSDITNFKHSRSHSDCTGLKQNNIPEILVDTSTVNKNNERSRLMGMGQKNFDDNCEFDTVDGKHEIEQQQQLHKKKDVECKDEVGFEFKQKLFAKIINTAIHYEGQYAVYAIQVCVVEDHQRKSWHIYRRYSRFLELKKHLVKRFPSLSKVPFPAKKAFQNTQRSVLEHRMALLNEFLLEVGIKADTNDDIYVVLRDFVEPDTNDKRIHGGAVIRTIETIVNPFKSGIRTIRNMPDNLVGGLSKIFLGRSPMKESSFLGDANVEQKSSEYPALTSSLNLLDEVFDLQSRSQWLRRGIINRLLGAPWVSHTANKKIVQTAKSLIELDKIELILANVLNSIWPDGKQQRRPPAREDNTKLRTRMAAKISLFALVADDLKHVVGSETTRSGLLNFFAMLQNKTLNLRLILVLLNHILTILYKTDDMTKHVK